MNGELTNKTRLIILCVVSSATLVSLCAQLINNHFSIMSPSYYDLIHYCRAMEYLLIDGNPYLTSGYVYLNYFLYMFFPIFILDYIAVSIIWFALKVFMFYYILKNEKNVIPWLIGSAVSIICDFGLLNVEMVVVFGLMLYYNNRKKSYSPIFLLLCLYKMTSLIPIGLILLIEVFYDKDFKNIIRRLPFFLIVGGILIISFFTSLNMGFLANLDTVNEGFLFFYLRPAHFMWFIYPIKLFFDKSQINQKTQRKIMIVICVISGILLVLWCIDFVLYRE